MLNDFFKLNQSFEEFDEARMDSQLKTSRHIVNILYRPERVFKKKLQSTKFENTSLSKTTVESCTFRDCIFEDCLFIGTVFKNVEFHRCEFINCNFYKCTLEKVYAKPKQFRRSIQNPSYANIAVHLYHQLRENYYQDSQREFKNEAEYYFSRWKRIYEHGEAKRNNVKWYKYIPVTAVSKIYDLLLGYGYRLRNLVATTSIIIITLISINHLAAAHLFVGNNDPSILKSVYFTITTMATLGASGYSALTEAGYAIVTINVLAGISILSATVNSIFRKVIR